MSDQNVEPYVRPCKRIIETSAKTFTPDDINKLASNIGSFCEYILQLNSLEEIKELALAIKDNWHRYIASC